METRWVGEAGNPPDNTQTVLRDFSRLLKLDTCSRLPGHQNVANNVS